MRFTLYWCYSLMKSQSPIPKLQAGRSVSPFRLEFGAWSFIESWILEIGISRRQAGVSTCTVTPAVMSAVAL